MQEIGMAVGETAKNLTRQYLFPSLLFSFSLLFSLKIKFEFFSAYFIHFVNTKLVRYLCYFEAK